MVGYPMGFLAKLGDATGDPSHHAAAREYAEFALSCGDDLVASHFAHKVAWGAAALAATGQTQWSTLATDITDRLVQAQDLDGAWLADEPAHTKYDQTAEVAIWLYEISTELERAAHQAGDPPDPASG